MNYAYLEQRYIKHQIAIESDPDVYQVWRLLLDFSVLELDENLICHLAAQEMNVAVETIETVIGQYDL
jgi:hypothetical protein